MTKKEFFDFLRARATNGKLTQAAVNKANALIDRFGIPKSVQLITDKRPEPLYMKTSPKGLQLIKGFEGLKLKPYLCSAGVPTIGWGSTRYEDGRKVKMSDPPITLERADSLFETTLLEYEVGVIDAAQVPLKQREFDALVSFSYNLGVPALSRSTLRKKLNRGDKTGAADELLKWNRANGKPLAGLTRRRKAERKLFLTGVVDLS